MTSATRPRCHRGEILRAHAHEVSRASQYIGTRGMSGAGDLMIRESRGRLVRRLMEVHGAKKCIGHMAAIMKAFANVEARGLWG